jgi:hypothetical protein
MKKKDERRYGSFWTCPNCEGHPEIPQNHFVNHLKEKHGITDAKGKRSMISHLDGDTWFAWNYEWEIGGLKFFQSTCDKRSPESAAMWMGEE